MIELKKLILQYFYNHRMLIGQSIDELTVKNEIKAKLSNEAIKQFPYDLRRLRTQKFIDFIEEKNRYKIYMGEKAYDTIYPLDIDDAIDKTIQYIAKHFKYSVGRKAHRSQSLSIAYLESVTATFLNPRQVEHRFFKHAITELLIDDLIVLEKTQHDVLIRLSAKTSFEVDK